MTTSTLAATLGLGPYDIGRTAHYALSPDLPITYCLYVPKTLDRQKPVHLIVAVHGSNRVSETYRDAFAPLADYTNAIVLAPLFPIDPLGDGNADGYKYLAEGKLRYDLMLLRMIDKVAARYQVSFSRVGMFGFSGGAHFVHRFMLLHPTRLTAAAICAPGSVTLLDNERDWWVGTSDVAQRFGVQLDLPALRQVAVHLSVGRLDRETWEITHQPGGRYWMDGANDAGATRPERLAALRRSLEGAGVTVEFEEIPGAAHSFVHIEANSRAFLWRHLTGASAPANATDCEEAV